MRIYLKRFILYDKQFDDISIFFITPNTIKIFDLKAMLHLCQPLYHFEADLTLYNNRKKNCFKLTSFLVNYWVEKEIYF